MNLPFDDFKKRPFLTLGLVVAAFVVVIFLMRNQLNEPRCRYGYFCFDRGNLEASFDFGNTINNISWIMDCQFPCA